LIQNYLSSLEIIFLAIISQTAIFFTKQFGRKMV